MSKESGSWVEKILKKPHIILSFLALFVLTGIMGTLLTLVFIPIVFIWTVKEDKVRVK